MYVCALRTGEFLEEYGNISYTRKFVVDQIEKTHCIHFDAIAKQNYTAKHIRESSKDSSDRWKITNRC